MGRPWVIENKHIIRAVQAEITKGWYEICGDELKKLCGVSLVRTVGLADTSWTTLWLGHRDLKDKETKEAGSNVGGAIIVLDGVTVQTSTKQVQSSKTMRCKSCRWSRLKQLLRHSSSASNASLVVYVWGLISISHVLSGLLSSTDLNWDIGT